MRELNTPLKLLLTSLVFIVLFNISGAQSMEEGVSSATTKAYPTRVALSLCTYLTDTISLNDETAYKAYSTLRNFNKAIGNVLTRNDNDDKWAKEFHLIFPEALDTLKVISSNTAFSELSQRISLTLEPELNKLFVKTSDLNNISELKEMLKKEAPVIAAKEFLDRNSGIKPRSIKCEDCGLGYFRQHKNSKGKINLECQLCHHRQSSNLNLSVKHFVNTISNSDAKGLDLEYSIPKRHPYEPTVEVSNLSTITSF